MPPTAAAWPGSWPTTAGSCSCCRRPRITATRSRSPACCSCCPRTWPPMTGGWTRQLVSPYVVRRLKDDVARGDPPQPISRRHPPQPIVVSPTVAGEGDPPAAARPQQAGAAGAARHRLLPRAGVRPGSAAQAGAVQPARPAAEPAAARRRACGIAPVEHAGRRRLEALQLYRGDIALPEADLDDTEDLALSGVAAHLPDDDLREEQRLVGHPAGAGGGGHPGR